MNILFLTLLDFESIEEHNIYTDLLRKFSQYGHNIYAISPIERRKKQNTHLIKENDVTILKLKIGNTQKTNIIEKGISTILIEGQLIRAIKKYFSDIKFDLVLYATPPVTIAGTVRYIKKRDGALSYLMLKDIFPQNAVDLKMLKKKGMLYAFFRKKEKQLYDCSDYIGCPSPENINFIRCNNPHISPEKVEICVNCMEPYGKIPNSEEIKNIRKEYNLPINRRLFLYGGNLGKPQGIDFLQECLNKTKDLKDAYFLIVGDGTERESLKKFIDNHKLENVRLLEYLPKDEFDRLTTACDVGMIFLNYLTTTPNTPSRLLAYTNAAIPVLAVTDPCTDVGKIIEEGKFGWSCLSNDVNKYYEEIRKIIAIEDMSELKANSYAYLLNHYIPEYAYNSIIQHFKEEK